MSFEICCCVLNIAAALWGYFYPEPYSLCLSVLLAIPVLSIPAIRWMRGSDSKILVYTLLGPVTALAVRAFDDLDVAAMSRIVLFACGVAAALAILVFMADRSLRRSYWMGVCLVAVLYGFGAVPEVNMLLDSGGTKHLTAPIVSRDYFVGRHSTFEVDLGPWGDRVRTNKNLVSWNTYVALRHATVACIDLGPGALGVGWSRISACGNRAISSAR